MDLFLSPGRSGVAGKGHDGLGPKHCHQDMECVVCQGDMGVPRLRRWIAQEIQ